MTKAPEGNIYTNHNRFPHIHFSSSHSFCPAVFAGVRVYVHVIQESCTVLRSWVRNAGRVHITLKPARTERAQLRLTADLQWVITWLWTTLRFLGSCKWQKHVLRSLGLTLTLSLSVFFSLKQASGISERSLSLSTNMIFGIDSWKIVKCLTKKTPLLRKFIMFNDRLTMSSAGCKACLTLLTLKIEIYL